MSSGLPQPQPPSPPPATRAAGAIIALGVGIGLVAGVATRQPTLGVLAGFAIGVAIALLLWLRDTRGR